MKDFAGRLKAASFLPHGKLRLPTDAGYEAASRSLLPAFLDRIYDGDTETIDAIGEAFWETDDCAHDDIKQRRLSRGRI